jgi:Transglycosylase SLT domain
VRRGRGRADSREGVRAVIVRRRFQAALIVLIVVGTRASTAAALEPPRTLAVVIHAAATWAGVAPELLAAVVWVESRGQPWALGIRGRALYPKTRAEALALVQAVGGRADIGLAQIHYPIWGPAFGLRPEELLDPWVNLHVAARILRIAMVRESESWGGVGRYHSGTLRRKWAYASRVAAVVHALRRPILPQGIDLAL